MDAQRSEFDGLRNNLERRLRDAQSLNDSLQAEIARVRSEKSEMERRTGLETDLQAQLDDARRQNESLEKDLQAQLADVRQQNQDLEDEWRTRLNDAQKDARETEDRLRTQLEEVQNQPRGFEAFDDFGGGINWRQRYEAANNEVEEQRQLAEEVRRDASRFLQEMQALALQHSDAMEKEDQLQDQIRRLEQEVKVWKSRYARAQASGAGMRSPSLESSPVRGNVGDLVRDVRLIAPNGAIKDMHLTSFQLAIDDLLQQSRGGNDRMLSDSIKMIVMAVKLISIDMENEETRSGADQNRPSKLRLRLSQAANNIITATKSYGTPDGESTVQIIDEAAFYLSSAVTDIVKALKIRRSSPEELAEEDEVPATPDYMYSARPAPLRTKGSISSSSINSGIMRNVSTSSAAYSSYRYSGGYSQNTSPQAMNGDNTQYTIGQGMGMLREDSVLDFKNYVEDVNVSLTRNIQPLVNTIRSQPAILADDPLITTYVDEISEVVFQLVSQTKATIQELSNVTLSKQAPPITDVLSSTARDLVSARERGDVSGIPQLVFKISRTTKAFLSRLQKIESGELNKDSPSSLDVL